MNSVYLIGRVRKSPKYLNRNGRRVAQFVVSTSEPFWDENGAKGIMRNVHRVVAWGSHLKGLDDLVANGKKLSIEGRLVNHFYAQKNGKNRMISEVEVRDMTPF